MKEECSVDIVAVCSIYGRNNCCCGTNYTLRVGSCAGIVVGGQKSAHVACASQVRRRVVSSEAAYQEQAKDSGRWPATGQSKPLSAGLEYSIKKVYGQSRAQSPVCIHKIANVVGKRILKQYGKT